MLARTVCCLALALPAGAQGSDSCATAQVLPNGAGSPAYDTTSATTDGAPDPGCLALGAANIGNDVWFAWQPTSSEFWSFSTCGDPSDTKLAIYAPQACPPVAPLACQDDACGLQSTLYADVVVGTTYLLRVGNFPGVAGGAGALVIAPAGPGPANDDCATPMIVPPSPLPQAIAFDNTLGSTDGPPEPTCFFFNTDLFVGDHWFQWVAPANGDFSFTSCGNTTVDTKLAIYAGGGCPTLAPLDCSDDDCGLQTRVELLGTTAGSTYTLRVAHFPAYPGGPGTILVENFTPPAHADACSAAGVIGGEGTFAFDNAGATTDGLPDASCFFFAQSDITNDVWWRWTPALSGDYSFATCGGGPDTKIAVYTLQPCPPTAPLGCLDDSCGLQQDLVVTALTASNEYLIRLGNFPGAAAGIGDLVIARVGGPPAPGTNFCSTLPNSTGSVSSISATGSSSVAANDLVLVAESVPVMQPGIFYYGPLEISVPFGHGTRCVGGAAGTIARLFPFAVADPSGVMSFAVDNTNPTHAPQLGVPGSTWKFQAWFRDPAAGLPGFNLSDGYSITLTP